MTDIEKKDAIEKLEAILKTTPIGSWQIRDIARILLALLTSEGPPIPDVDSLKDKPARTSRAAHV